MTAVPTVVCVTQAPFIGGAERSLIRLAGALDRTRYRPLVLTGHCGAVAQALRAGGLDYRQVALPPSQRTWPWPFAGSVLRIAATLHRQRAALVHVNDAPAHRAASLAARLLRLPRLCHLHFTYPADGLRWWLKWGFERALFASQFAKRDAQRQCPELFPERRCAVIPNGFDPPPPPDAGRLVALRAACGLEHSDAVVGFVGRVVEVKGVDDYLHMASALIRRHPRCRFLVVGDDLRPAANHRAAMEALAGRLGVAPACRFVGFRDDVWELLHLCDVVVMPSHVEPFGNVAVEAGAAGRPLVAARVGGIPEIVRDGETGLLVPPDDSPALAEAITALLRDPDRMAALGAAGYAQARDKFDAATNAQATFALYKELLRP